MKESRAKSFKNVYAKDPDQELERVRTSHLNNDEETEVEKSELVDGNSCVFVAILFRTAVQLFIIKRAFEYILVKFFPFLWLIALIVSKWL